MWLTKTALIYELIDSADDDTEVATDDDRRWFGEHQEPLPKTGIWLARYDGTAGAVFHVRRSIRVWNVDDPIGSSHVYAPIFTLVIGKVVLQAVIPNQSSSYPGWFAQRDGPYSLSVWPNDGSTISWPPSARLTDETITGYTQVGPDVRPI